MRTDVVFDTERRLKNPCPMPGSPDTLGRGDWIEWELSGSTDRGRIIGIVKPNDECQEYFCVAWHIRMGGIAERWILPKYVTAGFRGSGVSLFLEKVNWLYSDDFLKTPQEVARRVWDLEYQSLVKDIPKEMTRAEELLRNFMRVVDSMHAHDDLVRELNRANIAKPLANLSQEASNLFKAKGIE